MNDAFWPFESTFSVTRVPIGELLIAVRKAVTADFEATNFAVDALDKIARLKARPLPRGCREAPRKDNRFVEHPR